MEASRARALLFADLALTVGGGAPSAVADALRAYWEAEPAADDDPGAVLLSHGALDEPGLARVRAALDDLVARAQGDPGLALARRGGIDESIHASLPQPVSESVAREGGTARAPLRTVAPGRYTDFQLVARGGMGLVYSALDTELHRRVAFKMVLPGPGTGRETDTPTEPLLATPPPDSEEDSARVFEELRVRFLQEAWITGAMEHPGVVPVHELGRTERGIPYYTMRYVAGARTLKEVLAGRSGLDGRLALLESFLKVCDTIRYAHARGVVHRDLKPENIALGDFGEVIVLDWGLSKMEGRPDVAGPVWQDRLEELRRVNDLRTVHGAIGTPGYMAPEAVMEGGGDVDRRSDVYSLGTMLFEILTGRLPWRFKTFLEFVEAVMHEETPVATEIEPGVPDELATIAARALQREPGDRYASVDAMAADLRHWLSEGTIERRIRSLLGDARQALAASRRLEGNAQFFQLDRAARLCSQALALRSDHEEARTLQSEIGARRHSGIRARVAGGRRELLQRLGVVALAACALAALFVAHLLGEERRTAQEAMDRVQARLGAVHRRLGLAERKWEEAVARLAHAHASTAERAREAGWIADAQLLAAAGAAIRTDGATLAALAAASCRPAPLLARLVAELDLRAVAFDDSGEALVAVGRGGTVHRLSLASGALETLGALPEQDGTGTPTVVAAGPAPGLVAIGTDTGHVFVLRDGVVNEGGIGTENLLPRGAPYPRETTAVTVLHWLPNAGLLWSGHHGGVLQSWQVVPRGGLQRTSWMRWGDRPITRMVLSPERWWLWVADDSGEIRHLHWLTAAQAGIGWHAPGPVLDLVPDETEQAPTLRTCTASLRVQDYHEGQRLTFTLLDAGVEPQVFARLTPDVERLVAVGADGAISVWDLALGRAVTGLGAGDGAPRACALTPDGTRLAVVGAEGTLRVWDLGLREGGEARGPACVDLDGARVFRTTRGRSVVRVDPDGTEQVLSGGELATPVSALAAHPAGDRVAACELGGALTVWDATDGRTLAHESLTDGVPSALTFLPDGRTLVFGTLDGTLATWGIGSARSLSLLTERAVPVTALAAGPEGRLLAAGHLDGRVDLWTLDRRDRVLSVSGGDRAVVAVAVSPDGASLAWVDEEGVVYRAPAAEGAGARGAGRSPRGPSPLAVRFADGGAVEVLRFDGTLHRIGAAGAEAGRLVPADALQGAVRSWVLRSPIARLIELESRYGMEARGGVARLVAPERWAGLRERLAPWSDVR